MALNTRLTQNIDLQADGTALRDALGAIGVEINKIVNSSGSLNKNLVGGADKANLAFQDTLKTLRNLIGQATTLQNIIDGSSSRRTSKSKGLLDEQALGRQSAASAKLARDLGTTTTAAEALEKRLTLLTARFADLAKAGQTVSRTDLSKQFRINDALTQVNQLNSAVTRLNGKSLNTPSGGASAEMVKLRSEIERVNNELTKTAQNSRKSNFQPQIDQLRALVDQYQKLINVEIREREVSSIRSTKANTTAQSILNQTDAQRLAGVQRASSGYAFPAGVSATTSQKAAEDALAVSLNRRLALLGLIQKAQDNGASVAVVERLNNAYAAINQKLGEQTKLLATVNAEQNNSFLGKFQTGLGYAGKIAGASIAVSGVFAVINGIQQALGFIVQYEAALKQLQGISGSTNEQMLVLANGISEVSRSSTYSTLEITKAATVIAQAGYSAKETADVLKSAVTLSTASGSDPAQSVEVLTGALGAFHLQAGESARVVDTLVTALNQSKLSIDQMGAAIQYAGATAAESGVKFEELTTIAASLANAGIRSGSTIGTGIRQLLVDLQTPTADFKKELKDVGLTLSDVNVKALGFAKVVQNLSQAGFTAEAAYSSFETRAAAAFLAFRGQIGTYDQLALSIATGGAAAEAQARAMDSLGSQANRLKNDLGQLAVLLSGPLVDAVKLLTSLLANMVEGFIDMLAPLGRMISSMGSFGEVVKIVGFTLVGALFGPLGAAIGFFVGLASALGKTSNEMDALETKTSDSSSALTTQNQTVSSLEDAIKSLTDRQSTLKDGTVALQTETVTLASRFEDLYTYLGKATVGYDDLRNAMLRYRTDALKQASLDAQTLKSNAQTELKATQDQLKTGPSFASQLRAGGVDPSAIPQSGVPVFNRAQSALQSSDLADVTTVRNQVQDYSRDHNNVFRALVTLLDERLSLIKKAASLQAQIVSADQTIARSDAAAAPEEQTRYGRITDLHGQVSQAIDDNSGNRATNISRLTDIITREISFLRQRISATPKGGKQDALTNDLQLVQDELARLTREARKADEENKKFKPDTARKGLNLSGAQVAANLKTQFPGANPYSFGARPLATQQRLYNSYKAGTGPLAAKPGTSYHGSGHALDMTPLDGVSMDDIVAYLEGLGLEVVEALNERDPKTGAKHWHFAWKPKTSTFLKDQQNTVKALKDAAAEAAVGSTSSEVQAILSKAKAGTDTPERLTASLQTALIANKNARLAQYDTNHPVAGLTGEALAAQQRGRTELLKDITEDAQKYMADLYRAIGDAAMKAFDAASKALADKLKVDTYNVQKPVRDAASQIAIAGNPLNKSRNSDSGTQYYLQKQQEAAQLNSDRATVALQSNNETAQQNLINGQMARIQSLPEGEDKAGQLEKLRAAQESLNEAMRQTAELQQTINDRTAMFVQLPLNERLKNGAQAWAEQSGATKTFSDQLADSVGPALDLVTSKFSDMFTSLVKGQVSFKQALGGMLAAIGDFILQLIAKALALAAIKWFLKLIGVNIDLPAVGGGSLPIPKQMTGGMAGKPVKLMTGGSPNPYISQGVRNRDSVPALLAQDEFVVRGNAVRDIGVANMHAINRYGSKAVQKMGNTTVAPAPAYQETNVYLIKPEEKPQLGPRDIILAVTDDMMQGGQTKQLIKRIAQGTA